MKRPETEKLSDISVEILKSDPKGPGPRRFSMVAYTGATVSRYYGDFTVDLKGIARDGKTAMLLEHNDQEPVAVADEHETGKNGIKLSGYFLDTEEGKRVQHLADQGFPWKASIGIRPLKVETLEDGAEAEVNGRTVKGPHTIWRGAHLFETSFIHANPADLATEVQVMSNQEKKNMADTEQNKVALAAALPTPDARLVAATPAEMLKEFPKAPRHALEMLAAGKTLLEAKAEYASVLEKKLEKLKQEPETVSIETLKVQEGHRGLGFDAARVEVPADRFKGLPIPERAAAEISSDETLHRIFTPEIGSAQPEKLYASVLKYENARRKDGSFLMNPKTVALAAESLREMADRRFGPIDSEKFGSYGKTGPDYSAVTVKGFLGQFTWAFEQEMAGIWAPRVGLKVESNQETETHRWLGLFPQMTEWLGGIREDGMPIYSFAITNKLYRASIGIDKNDFKFQKFGLINMRMGEAGAIAAEHWNALVSTLLEANGTAYDGVAFFASTHTLGGASGMNAPSGFTASMKNDLTKADYSGLAVADVNNISVQEFAAGLLQATPHMRSFLANNGQPINGGARRFVIMVPQALEGVSQAAVRSERLNYGQSNPLDYQGITYNVVVNPRLTNGARIYILREDSNNKPFILQEPGAPEVLFQGPGSYLEWVQHKFGFGIESTRAAGYGAWECAVRATFSV